MKIEDNILTIEEPAKNIADATITFVLSAILLIGAFATKSIFSFYAFSILLGVGSFIVYQGRAISCIMNKETGIIHYARQGIFNSIFAQTHAEYAISAVAKVEIKRYISRGRDGFECRLVLGNDERIRVSPSGIGLSKCEQIARTVREFLELERPVAFVD